MRRGPASTAATLRMAARVVRLELHLCLFQRQSYKPPTCNGLILRIGIMTMLSCDRRFTFEPVNARFCVLDDRVQGCGVDIGRLWIGLNDVCILAARTEESLDTCRRQPIGFG